MQISDSTRAYEVVKPVFEPWLAEQECFVALLVNTKHEPIDARLINLGTLNSVHVHPRDVFREAIRQNAHAIIIAHNHPSGGELRPSATDMDLTRRLIEAGKLLGIEVLEHLIVGPDGYVSMRLNWWPDA